MEQKSFLSDVYGNARAFVVPCLILVMADVPQRT
jgi:hypothetical protein